MRLSLERRIELDEVSRLDSHVYRPRCEEKRKRTDRFVHADMSREIACVRYALRAQGPFPIHAEDRACHMLYSSVEESELLMMKSSSTDHIELYGRGINTRFRLHSAKPNGTIGL